MKVTLTPLMFGAPATIDVDASTTCAAFQAAAAAKLGFAQPNHIRLIFAGTRPPADDATIETWGLREGCMLHVLRNMRGEGGIMSTPMEEQDESTLRNTRPTNDHFTMGQLIGRRISATTEDDRGVVLELRGGDGDAIWCGAGPTSFELEDGGGLRVRGVAGFDDLVGKKIERIEYREWRAKGPGPGRAKTAAARKAAKTGAVLFLEGGAQVFGAKNASGSEPGNLVWIGCDGDEGGAFDPGYPAEDW